MRTYPNRKPSSLTKQTYTFIHAQNYSAILKEPQLNERNQKNRPPTNPHTIPSCKRNYTRKPTTSTTIRRRRKTHLHDHKNQTTNTIQTTNLQTLQKIHSTRHQQPRTHQTTQRTTHSHNMPPLRRTHAVPNKKQEKKQT